MGAAHHNKQEPGPARKQPWAWPRWLAVLLSSTLFFLVSCTAVTRLGMEVLSRDQAKVGAPPWHTVKLVLATPDGQLHQVDWEPAGPRNLALQRASPLLPSEAGTLEVGDTQLSYVAQPDGPHAQIVEVTVRAPDVPSFFRYRVQVDEAQRTQPGFGRRPDGAALPCTPLPAVESPCAEPGPLPPDGVRIEPLYSRIGHQGYMFASLPLGVALAWAIRFLARRWLRRLDGAGGQLVVSG